MDVYHLVEEPVALLFSVIDQVKWLNMSFLLINNNQDQVSRTLIPLTDIKMWKFIIK